MNKTQKEEENGFTSISPVLYETVRQILKELPYESLLRINENIKKKFDASLFHILDIKEKPT